VKTLSSYKEQQRCRASIELLLLPDELKNNETDHLKTDTNFLYYLQLFVKRQQS